MWQEIHRFIDSYESFAITAHVNPDGDAIGSEVALKLFLENQGKDAFIVNPSDTPPSVAFLDPDNEIRVFVRDVDKKVLDDVDAIFILDLNNWDQLGVFASAIQHAPIPRACIDHHQGADDAFADVIVTDTSAAATGILVHELIGSMNGMVTRGIADALYTALITDTGTFRFSNTDRRAFDTAGQLVSAGADPFTLYRAVYATKSWEAGRPVLSTISSAADGRLAWIHASQKMAREASANYDDMDGFVDLVRAIRGVELVLFFKETPDGNVKVSLRSNGNADAFAIARHFGGGGHRMASGMRLEGPLDEAIRKTVEACVQMDGIKAPD
jgi:phosphoesterase RecJ-like protein